MGLRCSSAGWGSATPPVPPLPIPASAWSRWRNISSRVIDWHRQGLTPLGSALAADPRCRFRHTDFFALMAAPDRRWDAILLDIDHAPDRWLAPSNADFYGEAALGRLRDALQPEGVFALWSDDRPDPRFEARLAAVFAHTDAVEVNFPNPLSGESSRCTIYRARG